MFAASHAKHSSRRIVSKRAFWLGLARQYDYISGPSGDMLSKLCARVVLIDSMCRTKADGMYRGYMCVLVYVRSVIVSVQPNLKKAAFPPPIFADFRIWDPTVFRPHIAKHRNTVTQYNTTITTLQNITRYRFEIF